MLASNGKGKSGDCRYTNSALHSPTKIPTTRSSLISKFRKVRKIDGSSKDPTVVSSRTNLQSPRDEGDAVSSPSPHGHRKCFTSDFADPSKGCGKSCANADEANETKDSVSPVQRRFSKMKKLKRLSLSSLSNSEDLDSKTPTPTTNEGEGFFSPTARDSVVAPANSFELDDSFIGKPSCDSEWSNDREVVDITRNERYRRRCYTLEHNPSLDGKRISILSDTIRHQDYLNSINSESQDSMCDPINERLDSNILSRSQSRSPIYSPLNQNDCELALENTSSFDNDQLLISHLNSVTSDNSSDGNHARLPSTSLHLRSRRFMSVDDISKPILNDNTFARKYSEIPKTSRVKERQAMLTSACSDKKFERRSRTQRECRKKSIPNTVQEKKTIYTKKERENKSETLLAIPAEPKRIRYPSPRRVSKFIRKITPSFSEEKLLQEAVNEQDLNALDKLLTGINKDDSKINFLFPPGISLLHQACYLGNVGIVRILVEKGAKVELKTRRQLSPLKIAVLFGHFHIAELLIEMGADDRDIKNGIPLHDLRKLENRN